MIPVIPVFWSIILLFFTAFFLPLFSHFTKTRFELRGGITFLAILISLFILLSNLPAILNGKMLLYAMGAWKPPFGIVLAIDGFNYLLSLIITGIGALIALYSIKHVEVKTGLTNFYVLLLLLIIGLLGIVLTGDLFNLYVFFEMAAISSYALVAFRSRKAEALEGSFKYLVLGSVGTSFILLAIAFLYGSTGTLNMADIALKLETVANPLIPSIAFALMLAGFAVKSVIVPMHAWKPDALFGTSSEIAGLIAGVSSAVGLYCIFRLVYTIFNSIASIYPILVVLSILTMVIGGLMALVQTDLKRLLAYSSISQSGYIALGLSLAAFSASGATGGLFHILNHAIAKALLFLCVGVLVYKVGTHDMNELGGLANKLPLTTFAFTIGALAIIGVPPLNGFVSKFLIYMAGVESGHFELTIIAILMSTITLAYYSKAIYRIFFGAPVKLKNIKGIPLTMAVPIAVLVMLCIIIGLFPQLALKIINPAVNALSSRMVYIQTVLP